MMLEKLTKEQEKIMIETKDNFLSLLDKKLDEKAAKEGVRFVYQLAKLKSPMVIILDSPLACQFLANWSQVESQVESQVKSQKLQVFYFSYDALWASAWTAFYSFFQKIKIASSQLFEKYEKYIKSGVFSSIYLEKLAILCRNPTFIARDEKGRLHCTHDYAIAFRDGYGQHYVHGVAFEPELFQKIFKDKKITAKEILSLKNAEQRACTIQFFGYEKILKEVNAKKLDAWKVKSKITGKMTTSELFEFELEGMKVRFLKVEDHTEHKITTLGVPVEKQTETTKGAIAWTFGMKTEKYNPKIES